MSIDTNFILDGANVFVQKTSSECVTSKLPAKIYSLRDNPMMGFYLTQVKETFQVPSKVYGSTVAKAEKVIKTFTDRVSASTGVLMTGDKGTGKTLTLSLIANAAIKELGLPVVLIQDPYVGERFENFIHSLGEICLVFDEFGKMYPDTSLEDKESISQQRVLTILDGVDRTRRLVIMTENDKNDICDAILNRPSRAYYHFKFGKLEELSIEEFCNDKGVPESVKEEIIMFCRKCRIFSFDMLQSIVEEYQRFGESNVEKIAEELNVEYSSMNKDVMIILRIIHRVTGEEYELDGGTPKVLPVPTRYNETNIHFHKKGDPEDKEFTYINDSQLVSSNNGKNIYATSEFIIQTQVIEQIMSYESLF